MIEHFCGDSWESGPVSACPNHSHQGRALNLKPFKERNHVTVEGVAKTGQVSDKGTVAHREWFDGRVDAKANVKPVTAKLSELRRQANER